MRRSLARAWSRISAGVVGLASLFSPILGFVFAAIIAYEFIVMRRHAGLVPLACTVSLLSCIRPTMSKFRYAAI